MTCTCYAWEGSNIYCQIHGSRVCHHCLRPVRRCHQGTVNDPCLVRCLYDRPRRASRKRPCLGWVHEADDWHICDSSGSPAVMAEPRPREAACP